MLKELLGSRMAAVALIVATSICVYATSLGGDFVYDDIYQVVGNPWIQDTGHISDILFSQAWGFEGTSSNYYRPLAFLIYAIDYRLFGFDPWGFHLVSILLHSAVAVLVFLLASKLMRDMHVPHPNEAASRSKEVDWFPLFAALLFSTHPANSEPVMWISSLSDIAFTLFYLLALYTYIRSSCTTNVVITSILFFIACLGKETALTLPIMLFAYDALVRRDVHLTTQGILRLLKRYGPLILVAAVYLVMRTDAIGGFTTTHVHHLPNTYLYVINIMPLFAQYLGMLVLPTNLSVFHEFHPIASLLSIKGLGSIAVLACYLGACYKLTQSNRVLAFCLLWIVIPLLPVLYIPGLGESVFAERYLYLPSAGFAIFASGIASLFTLTYRKSSANIPMVTIPLLLLACLYAFGTVSRTPVWESNVNLWTDARNKYPEASTIHVYLGSFLYIEGQFDAAEEELKKAIQLKPNRARAHYRLGIVYAKRHRMSEAIVEFNEALRYDPDNKIIHYYIGLAYAETGQWIRSIDAYKSALDIDPDYFNANLAMGAAYQQTNRLDLATFHFREAVRLNPDSAEAHHNLGFVYASQRMLDQAATEYLQALSLKPDYALAHHNLGVAYGRKGIFDLAISELESALRITPNVASIYFDLGVTYVNKGEPEKAVRTLQKALDMQPDHSNARQLLQALQTRSF